MEAVKKILIIDDERMFHTMLQGVFASHGLGVVSAFTGEEGLTKAVQDPPDLILLDVILPGIKGREVCKRLKADPVTQAIPVLFVTAKDSEDDIQAELAVGGIGHVTKPVNSMALVKQIKKILGMN